MFLSNCWMEVYTCNLPEQAMGRFSPRFPIRPSYRTLIHGYINFDFSSTSLYPAASSVCVCVHECVCLFMVHVRVKQYICTHPTNTHTCMYVCMYVCKHTHTHTRVSSVQCSRHWSFQLESSLHHRLSVS